MKIAYMSTLDDAIALQMKLAMSLKTIQKSKYVGLLGMPLFFVFVYVTESSKDIWGRIGISLLIACVYGGLYLLLYRSTFRRNIQKIIIEARGTKEDVPAEYELTDDQLIYRESGRSVAFDLDSVVDIEEDDRAIFVQFKNKGMALLPDRIFKDENQKDKWLKQLKRSSDHKGAI